MATYDRRDFGAGGAVLTTITAQLTAGVTTSFAIAASDNWPDGSDGQFYVALDPTIDLTNPNSLEELILCDSRTGLTVDINSSGRGQQGTSDATHASGARAWVVGTARDFDEANYAVSETVGKITGAGELLIGDGANSLAALDVKTSGRIIVGNGTTAVSVAVSGDATLSSAGALTIANNAVENAMLADDAVDSPEIADGAIDTVHIGDDQVTAAKVADGAIDAAAKIANDVIDSQHYAAGSIDLEHMSANSVDSDQYVDGSIDTVHIGNAQVTAAKVAADVATQAELDAHTVVPHGVVYDRTTKTNNAVTNSTTWVDFDTATDITLAAAEGDVIECHFQGLWNDAAANKFLDVVTVVDAAPVNHFGTGGASGGGSRGWSGVASSFSTISGNTHRTLVSGDVSGGNVLLRLRVRAGTATNITINADANNAAVFVAKNLGQAL